MREHPVLELVLIGVVAALVGVGIGLVIDWFPVQGSAEADDIDTLYDVLLAASIPIFVLVMTVAIYSVVRFRARPGETHDGPPIHGDAKLEVAWVTIPFMLVTALAIYGWIVLTDIEEPQPDSLVVDVRGEQFAWSFAYPDEGGETVQTADLMLPVDRQVEFRVQTEDVIHSFWVPAFRLKTDTVPGITTRIRATPSEEGTYDVVCAELCGLGHSTMRQSVTVVPEDEFDTWLADQQEALAAAEGGAGQAPSEGQSPSGVAAQEPPEEEPAPEGGGGAGGESRSGGASGGGESGSGGASADGGGSGGEGSSGG